MLFVVVCCLLLFGCALLFTVRCLLLGVCYLYIVCCLCGVLFVYVVVCLVVGCCGLLLLSVGDCCALFGVCRLLAVLYW